MEYTAETSGAFAAIGGVILIIYLALIVLCIIGGWTVFAKAGKPGWGILIPIWNIILMLEIVGKPLWWIILMFIPFVNFIIAIILSLEMAKVFGKGAGFGIGLAFLPFIFYPILGLGSAQYAGSQKPQA